MRRISSGMVSFHARRRIPRQVQSSLYSASFGSSSRQIAPASDGASPSVVTAMVMSPCFRCAGTAKSGVQSGDTVADDASFPAA
nr:hypothetical protein [Ruminococcus callidus]